LPNRRDSLIVGAGVIGALFAQEAKSKETPKVSFTKRTKENAIAAASLMDGEILSIAGLNYQRDSSKSGEKSASFDLGVDGLAPYGIATPEHFGCEVETLCTQNFQRFVDWVTHEKGVGEAYGRYYIDDTIHCGGRFQDGKKDDEGGIFGGFSLKIGNGSRSEPNYIGGASTGLVYIGEPGIGSKPHEVKPALSIHNCREYYLDAVVSQDHDKAKIYTCGIRFTSTGNVQLANMQSSLLASSNFERGIVVGLNHQTKTNHDCFEKALINRINITQCRHPFYMSTATGDGWVFQQVTIAAYNTGGNGPLFHRNDPLGTLSSTAFEIQRSGNGVVGFIEFAQMDMDRSDSQAASIKLGAGTHRIMGGSCEISGVKMIRTTNPRSGRMTKYIGPISSSLKACDKNNIAAEFLGPVNLMGTSFSGHVIYGGDIAAHGVGFRVLKPHAFSKYTAGEVVKRADFTVWKNGKTYVIREERIPYKLPEDFDLSAWRKARLGEVQNKWKFIPRKRTNAKRALSGIKYFDQKGNQIEGHLINVFDNLSASFSAEFNHENIIGTRRGLLTEFMDIEPGHIHEWRIILQDSVTEQVEHIFNIFITGSKTLPTLNIQDSKSKNNATKLYLIPQKDRYNFRIRNTQSNMNIRGYVVSRFT